MAKNDDKEYQEYLKLKAELGVSDDPEYQEYLQLQQELMPPTQEQQIPGIAQTVGRKTTQGLTFGLGDEIGGLIQKGIASGADLIGANNPYKTDADLVAQGFTGDLQPSAYQGGVESERALLNFMSQSRPKTSFASELAGMVGSTPFTGPVAGAALQGAGSGETVNERLLGAGVGAASVPILGAAGRLVAREAAPGFANAIKPGVQNLYKAVTNHTGIADIPVMEAMSRQIDKFRGQALRTNAKKASDIVDTNMSSMNKRLSDVTKAISEETDNNLLMEFAPISDELRAAAVSEGNNSLLRAADKFDEAVLSGNYESVVDAYKTLIKNKRIYNKQTGTLDRYKGDTTGALERADDLFMSQNTKFLDDTFRVLELDGAGAAATYGDEFIKTMKDLKDLHLIGNHLEKSARVGRTTKMSPVDSMIGGGLGAAAGGLLGGTTGAIIGGAAGGGAAAALRQSVIAQNSLFKAKDLISQGAITAVSPVSNLVNRSVKGVAEMVNYMGDDLVAQGANPAILSAFSRSMANGSGPEAEKLATQIVNQFPQFFENSGYMSEINGKISDPNEIEIERAKITDQTDGNIKERAKAISNLNKRGSVYRTQLIRPKMIQNQKEKTDLQINRTSVDNAQEIDRLFKDKDQNKY